jgi:hypothetical protein
MDLNNERRAPVIWRLNSQTLSSGFPSDAQIPSRPVVVRSFGHEPIDLDQLATALLALLGQPPEPELAFPPAASDQC